MSSRNHADARTSRKRRSACRPDGPQSDDLAIPIDGIVGTEILQNFDLLIDDDGERIGFRR